MVGRNQFAEVNHLDWTHNNLLGHELDGRISPNWEKWITPSMTSPLRSHLPTAPQSTFCSTFLIPAFLPEQLQYSAMSSQSQPPSTELHRADKSQHRLLEPRALQAPGLGFLSKHKHGKGPGCGCPIPAALLSQAALGAAASPAKPPALASGRRKQSGRTNGQLTSPTAGKQSLPSHTAPEHNKNPSFTESRAEGELLEARLAHQRNFSSFQALLLFNGFSQLLPFLKLP